MSSKRLWEIWCPGKKAMERIAIAIPTLSARFYYNDFCMLIPTEPILYNMEMMNPETKKWVKAQRTRWISSGKGIYFPVVLNNSIQESYKVAVDNMINFLKTNPRP